jgi:type II secretory pathway component PulF
VTDFRYRGRSGRGELVTGRLEAEDIDGVANRLLNLGITPLDIAPAAAQQRQAGLGDGIHLP